MTRGKGVRPSGEHVDDDLVPVYFAEITSMPIFRRQYSAQALFREHKAGHLARMPMSFWMEVLHNILNKHGHIGPGSRSMRFPVNTRIQDHG